MAASLLTNVSILLKPTPPFLNVKNVFLLKNTDDFKHSTYSTIEKVVEKCIQTLEIKNKISIFSFSAVGRAELFSNLVQSKPYLEKLHGFIFSVATNSELNFFTMTSKS